MLGSESLCIDRRQSLGDGGREEDGIVAGREGEQRDRLWRAKVKRKRTILRLWSIEIS